MLDRPPLVRRARKGLTVVLSVIFKTSFASDDFHFTQYRVCCRRISRLKGGWKAEGLD